METCKTCGKAKPLSDFEKTPNGHRKSCRDCRRVYWREVNSGRKEYLAKKAKDALVRNMIKVWEHLREHPCVDCGNDDPVVLEFDHVKGKKDAAVSYLVSHTTSWEKIEAEIKKCEVRCANCHRKKTAKQLGWHSYMLTTSDLLDKGKGPV